MRARIVCLVAGVFAIGLVACGCVGQSGEVTLTVSMAMGLSPAVADFNASNATANADSQGVIHFTALSKAGTQLTVELQGPIQQGDMVDLTINHNFVSYDQPGSGWSSNGGSIAVDGVAPYRLRFVTVPMLAGSGAAKGSFVLNGSGTFL